MGLPITPQKLNDMWRAGYCRTTVEFARTTTDSPTDAKRRLEYLEQHVKECKECCFANALKGVEYQVAQAIGPEAEMLYIRGGDITKLPAFQQHFPHIFSDACRFDPILSQPEFKAWLLEKGKRGDYNAFQS